MQFCLRLVCCFFILLFFFLKTEAQVSKATGLVTNSRTGEPLAGASVTVKGTTNVSLSDQTGSYEIAVPKGAVLVVSFAGMAEQEQEVGQSGIVNFNLAEKAGALLNEVVVVGYGRQSRRNISGAISSIKNAQV